MQLLLTVEKIEHENFSFVLFPSCITQIVFRMYEQSAQQMTALVSEILLLRAASELRDQRVMASNMHHAPTELSAEA